MIVALLGILWYYWEKVWSGAVGAVTRIWMWYLLLIVKLYYDVMVYK